MFELPHRIPFTILLWCSRGRWNLELVVAGWMLWWRRRNWLRSLIIRLAITPRSGYRQVVGGHAKILFSVIQSIFSKNVSLSMPAIIPVLLRCSLPQRTTNLLVSSFGPLTRYSKRRASYPSIIDTSICIWNNQIVEVRLASGFEVL